MAFDECSVERVGDPKRLEAFSAVRAVAQTHAAFDSSESAATIGLLDLAVQQVERHLPLAFARSHIRDPLTEMGNAILSLFRRHAWTNIAATFRHYGASVSRTLELIRARPARL